MVRAKFKCQSVTETENGKSVILSGVTGGSTENEQFFKWTPSAKIEMGILNPAAAEKFQVGAEYYCDFTKVE